MSIEHLALEAALVAEARALGFTPHLAHNTTDNDPRSMTAPATTGTRPHPAQAPIFYPC